MIILLVLSRCECYQPRLHLCRPDEASSSDKNDWEPLLRPAFLEPLWQRVTGLWRAAPQPVSGISPGASPPQLLQQYIRSQAFPSADALPVGQRSSWTLVR